MCLTGLSCKARGGTASGTLTFAGRPNYHSNVFDVSSFLHVLQTNFCFLKLRNIRIKRNGLNFSRRYARSWVSVLDAPYLSSMEHADGTGPYLGNEVSDHDVEIVISSIDCTIVIDLRGCGPRVQRLMLCLLVDVHCTLQQPLFLPLASPVVPCCTSNCCTSNSSSPDALNTCLNPLKQALSYRLHRFLIMTH